MLAVGVAMLAGRDTRRSFSISERRGRLGVSCLKMEISHCLMVNIPNILPPPSELEDLEFLDHSVSYSKH